MPRWSTTCTWARTMSAMVMTGKDRPHGRPVAGLISLGPLVPIQPPRTFTEMMKKRSVSSILPGPITCRHQPGLPVTGSRLGDVMVPGQRVAHQDGIGFVGVEPAIGLVSDGEGAKLGAAIELQGGARRHLQPMPGQRQGARARARNPGRTASGRRWVRALCRGPLSRCVRENKGRQGDTRGKPCISAAGVATSSGRPPRHCRRRAILLF